MSDGRRRGALTVLDVAIGSAAAGIGQAGRAARAVDRTLAPVSGRLLAAGRAMSAETPLASAAQQVRDHGRSVREAVQAALLARVRALIPLVADFALDEIDLTELVIRRVDLDAVVRTVDVDGVAASIDLDAAAARLDIIGLAEYVVDGIDLPRIIRESTGSVASEGLREVRMQSMEADQAVTQFVDRVLLRRRPRRTGVALPPASTDGDGAAPASAPASDIAESPGGSVDDDARR